MFCLSSRKAYALALSGLLLTLFGCAKAAPRFDRIETEGEPEPSNASDASVEGSDDGAPAADATTPTPMPTPDPTGDDAGVVVPETDAGPVMPPATGPCDIRLEEDFTNEGIPDTFAVENGGISFTFRWYQQPTMGTVPGFPGGIPNKTGSTSQGGYIIVDSSEKGGLFDERLYGGPFVITTCERISLSFDNYLAATGFNEAAVEVRIDGGAWQQVASWDARTSSGVRETVDLSDAVVGKGRAFEFAFHYYDEEGKGIYWQIDDVVLSAQ